MDNDNYHMVTFVDELTLSSIEIWQKILNHRFIMEIYNVILPIVKFIFYIYFEFIIYRHPQYIRRNVDVLPNKATLEYTFYLSQVSSKGSLGEIVSAMSPYPWTYLK